MSGTRLTLLGLLGVSQAAFAGPWVHEPGRLLVRVSYDHTQARERFDDSGQRAMMQDARFMGSGGEAMDDAVFVSHGAATTLEWGLLSGVELVGRLPFTTETNRYALARGAMVVEQRNQGLGDLAAGLRAGARHERVAASFAALLYAPLYDNNPEKLNTEAGNLDPYDDRPALGQGTIDLEGTAAVGGGLPGGGWALFEQGLRLRNRQYSTTLPGRAQVGLRPLSPLAVVGALDWSGALDNGAAPDGWDASGGGSLIPDRQQHLAWSGGLMANVANGLAVDAGLRRVFAGRSTSAGTTLSVGVSAQR